MSSVRLLPLFLFVICSLFSPTSKILGDTLPEPHNGGVVLEGSGDLYAIGINRRGRFGDGSLVRSAFPLTVSESVLDVDGGTDHTLFILENGDLMGAGKNDYGQLGIGTVSTLNNPILIDVDVIGIAAGFSESYYIKSNGDLMGMGSNDRGQLGDGTQEDRLIPILIDNEVKSIKAVGGFASFLKEDGSLYCIGKNWIHLNGKSDPSLFLSPELVSTDILDFAVTHFELYYITLDGTLRGVSSFNGDRIIDTEVVRVESSEHEVLYLKENHVLYKFEGFNDDEAEEVATDVKEFSGGSEVGYFVTQEGILMAFGKNGSGQLGDGSNIDRETPVEIDSEVNEVSYGWGFFHYIKEDGTLFAAGENKSGQLGTPTVFATNFPIFVDREVSAISVGEYHSLYIKSDNSLWAAGSNQYGELGYEPFFEGSPGRDGLPIDRSPAIKIDEGVSAISAGRNSSLWIKEDGVLMSVGNNSSGQLGDGTTIDRYTPHQVDTEVRLVDTSGWGTSFFLKTDGTLMAMGKNGNGVFGPGFIEDVFYKHPVAIQEGVALFAVGLNDTIYVDESAQLFSIKSNSLIDDDVVAIDHNDGSTVYLKADGTLMGHGINVWGNLGGNSNDFYESPVVISNDVTAFSTGRWFCLFIKSDETLWGIGINTDGRLGEEEASSNSAPVQIDSNVKAVSAGTQYAFYVKESSIQRVDVAAVSPAGKLFLDNISVTITPPVLNSEIRYTLDGTEPSNSSLLYENPITITESTELRVKVFKDGFEPSLTVTENYTKSDYDVGPNGEDLTRLLPILKEDLIEKLDYNAKRYAQYLVEAWGVIKNEPLSTEAKAWKAMGEGTEIASATLGLIAESPTGIATNGFLLLNALFIEEALDAVIQIHSIEAFRDINTKVFERIGESNLSGLQLLDDIESFLLNDPDFSDVKNQVADVLDDFSFDVLTGEIPEENLPDEFLRYVENLSFQIRNTTYSENIFSYYDTEFGYNATRFRISGSLARNPDIEVYAAKMEALNKGELGLLTIFGVIVALGVAYLGGGVLGGIITTGIIIGAGISSTVQFELNKEEFALFQAAQGSGTFYTEIDYLLDSISGLDALGREEKHSKLLHGNGIGINAFSVTDIIIPKGNLSSTGLASYEIINQSGIVQPATSLLAIYKPTDNGEQLVSFSRTFGAKEKVLMENLSPMQGQLEFSSPAIDAIEEFRAVLYVGLGPNSATTREFSDLAGNQFFYSGNEDLVEAATEIRSKVISAGEISLGGEIEIRQNIIPGWRKVKFELLFAESDLDLHIGDNDGNWTGKNYDTNSDETNIPNSEYNGSKNNPEIVTINDPQQKADSYLVRITSVDTTIPENESEHPLQEKSSAQLQSDEVAQIEYSVIMTEYPDSPGLVGLSPPAITLHRLDSENDEIIFQIVASELTGFNDIDNYSLEFEEVEDSTVLKIESDWVTIQQDSTGIEAGNSIPVFVQINPEENLPEGIYKGNIVSTLGDRKLPISIVVRKDTQREYSNWLSENFDESDFFDFSVVGHSADPDGDGLSNQFEFSYELNPMNNDSSILAQVTRGERLELIFEPAIKLEEFSVQFSRDLTNWIKIDDSLVENYSGRSKVDIENFPIDAFYRISLSNRHDTSFPLYYGGDIVVNYEMNRVSDGFIKDSAKSLDAKIFGNVSIVEDGFIGSGIRFEPSSENSWSGYLEVGTPDLMFGSETGSSHSVSLFVRVEHLNQTGRAYSYSPSRTPVDLGWDGANGGFFIRFFAPEHIGTRSMPDFIPTSDLVLNKWYHIIVSWDMEDLELRGYLDGNHVATIPLTPGVDYFDETQKLIIGSSKGSTIRYSFPGSIDEFLVLDRALTNDEALRLHNIYIENL